MMNEYARLLEEERRRRTNAESFSLSDDRANLVPSFASFGHLLEQQQEQEYGREWADAMKRMNQRSHHDNDVPSSSLNKDRHLETDRRSSDDNNNVHSSLDGHSDESPRNFLNMKVPSVSISNHGVAGGRSIRSSTTIGSDGGINNKKRRRERIFPFRGDITLLILFIFALLFTLMILIVPIIIKHYSIPKTKWCPIYFHQSLNSTNTSAGSNGTTTPILDYNEQQQQENLYWNLYLRNQTYNAIHSIFPTPNAEYENPDFNTDPCHYQRLPLLLYLTLEEADFCTRLLASVIMGAMIGYERRSADRPAGIRTMSLVSLGSCFFTLSSIASFRSSTMGWDASRVSAAIPSGVGFLGAGLIWKGTTGEGKNAMHQVHGLTTAASVWLSAAVGVACGGRLYFISAYSMVLVMMILRYGPKIYLLDDPRSTRHYNNEEDMSQENLTSTRGNSVASNQDEETEKKGNNKYNRVNGHDHFNGTRSDYVRKEERKRENASYITSADEMAMFMAWREHELSMFKAWKENKSLEKETKSASNSVKNEEASKSISDGVAAFETSHPVNIIPGREKNVLPDDEGSDISYDD